MQVSRSGTDLVLALAGTDDQVVVQYFFSAFWQRYSEVQQVVFDDGTVWDTAELVRRSVTRVIEGSAGNDTLTGTSDTDYLAGGPGNDRLQGVGDADYLDGGAGDDTLIASDGYSLMAGGPGDDIYIVAGATWFSAVIERAGEGIDTLVSNAALYLPDEVENGTLGDPAGAGDLRGNTLDNLLTGNRHANVLDGGAGADTLVGGGGNDLLTGGAGDDTVVFGRGAGQDTICAETDVRANRLETLQFSADIRPSDIVGRRNGTALELSVDGTLDRITIEAFYADDDPGNPANPIQRAVFAGQNVTWDLARLRALADITVITGNDSLTGTIGSDRISGLAGNDTLIGQAGSDTLDGGAGIDRMSGGAGDDTYVVDVAGDSVTENPDEGIDLVQAAVSYTLGAHLENLTLTGTSALNGTGNALDNVLTGNAGANLLDGKAGADTLVGGAGNDTYVVDSAGDVVIEGPGAGTDLVQSAVSFTTPANIENLTLTGTAAIDATGNAQANTLTGNAAANRLDGGEGVDTLVGGAGDDTYVIDSVGETITELASQGTDLVLSSVSLTLPSNVELLTLTGDHPASGTGNTLANRLIGNTGSNLLDGQGGNDTLIGGLGDDRYVIDAAGDSVVEQVDEGLDTLLASVSYTTPAEVENLTLTGTAAINATGNALDNVLTGNAGANLLDGKAGADTLAGGAGNDTYVVDSADDVVIEGTNAGTDLIQTSVSFTAPANVENLTLTGTAAIDATGNALANTLVGNAGNNLLDGGAGADKMSGGAGDDVYRVDNAGDTITEAAGQGEDRVLSSISLTLGNFVEHLTLTGSGSISATGNTLANVLAGNDAANVLDGKAGADTLAGGAGNDTYVLGRGSGADRIVEEDATAGNADVLLLQSGVAPDQLWFRRLGDDLEVSIIGTPDKATVVGWYQDSSHHVEQIRTSTGKVLLDTAVDALVGAMAAFSPPTSGQTTLPANYRTALAPVIAANWH
jgi:Ca2+-binding RTX toxin-like protein